MRHVTMFAIFGLVAVLAVPTPQNPIGDQASIKMSERHRIQNTLKTLDLLQFSTQDYMTDLIYSILGMTAGQFLTSIDNNMKDLKNLIDVGMIQLHLLMNRLDPNTQQKIQNMISDAFERSLASMEPILKDLGLILPSITRQMTTKSNVSDVIYILLGISFEDFLRKITILLDETIQILTHTMQDLSNIAGSLSDQTIAAELIRISNTYVDGGRFIIRPLLASLNEIMPSSISQDVLSSVMSESLGFDVVNTGSILSVALEEVEIILTEFVTLINNSLGPSYPTVRDKVNKILRKSIKNVESTIDPILKVFLHFVPISTHTRQGGELDRDITATLLGVSLEDFLFYVDSAIPRITEMYRDAVTDIRRECMSVNPFLHAHIKYLMDRTMMNVERSVQPFINTISPILGDRRWVTVEEFVEITNQSSGGRGNVFCNFSMRTGYNKELVLHLISKAFGFDVVQAAVEMLASMYQMDNLYTKSWLEINTFTSDLHPYVEAEVNRILNNSLTTTRIAMRPAIDVLAPFIPTEGRFDKDIVKGMIHALQGVKYDQFQQYAQMATAKIETIAKSTALYVHQIIESGRLNRPSLLPNDPAFEVDAIIGQTLLMTQIIADPFFKVIAPILNP